jgi:hypothetical protein
MTNICHVIGVPQGCIEHSFMHFPEGAAVYAVQENA